MSSLRRKLPGANALFAFEAAARCRNFTKAAEELQVTQPAISRALNRFEDHLEIKLFHRKGGSICLSEEGEILYRHVADAFRRLEAGFEELERRKSCREIVSLSVSTAFTTHWLMPRIHELIREFPSVDLRFQLMPGHIGGPIDNVDLAMRFLDDRGLDHQAVLVLPEILIPVCAPSYLACFEELGVAPTLIDLSGSPTDWFSYFPSLVAQAQRGGNRLVLSDYAVVLQAATIGQGIAVGWLNVASKWLTRGDLVPLGSSAVRTDRLCYLVEPRSRPSRTAVRDIRDWILEHMWADVALVDRMYPELRVQSLAREVFSQQA